MGKQLESHIPMFLMGAITIKSAVDGHERIIFKKVLAIFVATLLPPYVNTCYRISLLNIVFSVQILVELH
jgi:hypothetical protein